MLKYKNEKLVKVTEEEEKTFWEEVFEEANACGYAENNWIKCPIWIKDENL